MGQGRNALFNLLTLVFLLLTFGCCLVTGLVATETVPPPLFAPQSPVAPTVAFVPTSTNTVIPPTATDTLTPTATYTLTNTPTQTLSVTPSITITPTPIPSETATASPTPTVTYTPTATETFTPEPLPPGPTDIPTNTPSPFPFNIRGSVVFTVNSSSAGCAWQGVAGQVFGINNEGLTGYRVRVSGARLGEGGTGVEVLSGTDSRYGPSGWEVAVASATNAETYYVELLSDTGTVLSPPIPVVFPNNCTQNLALVNFEQTRARP